MLYQVEKTDADQLHVYSAADLCLCFAQSKTRFYQDLAHMPKVMQVLRMVSKVSAINLHIIIMSSFFYTAIILVAKLYYHLNASCILNVRLLKINCYQD